MRTTTILLVAMAMVGGCGGGDNPDDAEPDQVEDVTKADVVYPQGEFDATAPKLGELALVTLNADKTFERRVQTVDCVPALHCNPNTDGTYKFTHSSTTRYIRFYDQSGAFLDRYAWKLSGDKLSLRAENTTHWLTFVKKVTGAGLGESCGGFIANAAHCQPGLVCVYTGVPDLPGTCQNPNTNACVAAGGSCVAPVPGSCDNGAIGDARQYSCGGGLGVECCLPAPAPTGPACNTASDCSGILPQFCQVCSDGTTACAHWACEQGHCTTAVCQ
jgi:hypothetical protein